jgi:ATP-dependent helicase HrpA
MERLSEHDDRPLLPALASALRQLTGLEVDEADLDESAIEDHFRFNIAVTGEDGDPIASGRSLPGLRETLGGKAREKFMDLQGGSYHRDGATSWEFGELALSIRTESGSTAWPALQDQETAVGLRLFDTWDEAALSHIDGVLRLLSISLADKLSYLRKHHGLSSRALMAWSPLGPAQNLVSELVWKSLAETAGDLARVRDDAAFASLCRRVRNEVGKTCLELADQLNQALSHHGRIRSRLSGTVAKNWPDLCADIEAQLQDLIYPGFLSDLEPGRLEHYPRYLKAIEERLDQNEQNPHRDRQRMAQVQPWWDRYIRALERGELYDEHLDAFRWLLEEYRVSLFAQRLGTDGKVSQQRLEQSWDNTGLN